MTAHWDRVTLESRISDTAGRRRHAGGSPDENEIAAYATALSGAAGRGTALVLGMTPELRRLALSRFRRVFSVDNNPEAILLYRDWVDATERAREVIVESDWRDLTPPASVDIDAVLGDGVFGNLPDIGGHRALLGTIGQLLAPAGRFVTRHALIPEGFDARSCRAESLIEQFRAGRLDEAEFGFGMRIVGHYHDCYDRVSFLLDNQAVFARCEDAYRAGRLTAQEIGAIRRYSYGGRNCLLPQSLWEELLRECGFDFRVVPCTGKAWYAYYPVYDCRPARR
jgi:hypothetical protein